MKWISNIIYFYKILLYFYISLNFIIEYISLNFF
uniref:Uncharacterized protein n=1 Tax=viral metagenome TaxID=1070528 RepID=A0A6C0AEA9_9ZZZZ